MFCEQNASIMKSRMGLIPEHYPPGPSGGSHYTDECPAYPTYKKRKGKITNECFVCLRKGHSAADCRAGARTCYHCGKRGHHRSLCMKKFDPQSRLDPKAREIKSAKPTMFNLAMQR